MNTENQKGVSLILTFFIMIVLLAVVLSVSIILYSEVRVIRNIGDSAISLMAADSGIEKVLYYDNQVVPTGGVRGLCSLCDATLAGSCVNETADSGMTCSCQPGFPSPNVLDAPSGTPAPTDTTGCDSDKCNYCTVVFSSTDTNFKSFNQVTAEVYPSLDGASTDFRIRSKGIFESAQRQIQILTASAHTSGAIEITNACATPVSTAQGVVISITADIKSNIANDTIGIVTAKIYDESGNPVRILPLSSGVIGGLTYSGTWTATDYKAYYIDIYAEDTLASPNRATLTAKPYPTCLSSGQ